MQFGISTSADKAAPFARAGFDFLEIPVQRAFQPEAPDEAVEESLRQAAGWPLPARVANTFLPGDIKAVGPGVDRERLARYAEAACRRARRIGVEIIVFGSGKSRSIPDGFDRAKAEQQLVEYGRTLGAAGRRHGIVFVAEPLRRAESNVLNTVQETARLVREVAHPHFLLLVDAYHWETEKDSADDIVANADLLRHAHIAAYGSRVAPGAEASDFTEFFRALKAARYTGRLAVECKWTNPDAEAPRALAELRRFAEAAGL
ncbi:MAG: sugar phosphate isomerase/epimerase [Candidatus Sumerlaeota bacterium]|nr:sugar phosphate isomerase/epimerase [Candidatus Sumerlaeota bacterium]